MLITLQDAKDKFHFRLANFCIMPTHIHLLIAPTGSTNISGIMQWIKTRSARRWNCIHGSTDHLWGERYFARAIRHTEEFNSVNDCIDQNPVTAGLAHAPADWKASGAFYKARHIPGLVDFAPFERQAHIKLLPPIPSHISKLIPSAQLEYVLRYFGAYTEAIDRLRVLVPTIPRLSESVFLREPPACLHYYSETADYVVYEYNGEETMYGLVKFSVFSEENGYRKFGLSELKGKQPMRLDLGWEAGKTKKQVTDT
jgi:REP element-mobilizing transposase RayT